MASIPHSKDPIFQSKGISIINMVCSPRLLYKLMSFFLFFFIQMTISSRH